MDDLTLKRLIRNPKLADKLILTPEQAFDQAMHKLKLTYHYKTDSLALDGKQASDAVAMAKLKVHLNNQDEHEIAPLIKDLMVIWKNDQETRFITRMTQKMQGHASTKGQIEAWVKAVTGNEDKLDVAVVSHFVWQVKRKMCGLPVENHMCVVLFGRSGGGKSVAVSKLVSPMADIAITTDMGIFDDTFARRMLSRNFVVFFDELQGSSSVDINNMKQIITATNIEWRGMRSEQLNSLPQKATFIGCSNDPVKERICDPTSARRFWELECKCQIDWDAINTIDYLSLWRSIDENSDCPVKPLIPEIRREQEKLINLNR